MVTEARESISAKEDGCLIVTPSLRRSVLVPYREPMRVIGGASVTTN